MQLNKKYAIDLEKDSLIYLTPPKAPVLVTTKNSNDVDNIGVFEHFMSVSNKPPRIILSINRESDTFKNILLNLDFGVCILQGDKYLNDLYKCGKRNSSNISEFEFTEFTAIQSDRINPSLVKESIINFECKLLKVIDVGDHSLIIGDVIYASCSEDIFNAIKLKRRKMINPLYHISSGIFMKLVDIKTNSNKVYKSLGDK